MTMNASMGNNLRMKRRPLLLLLSLLALLASACTSTPTATPDDRTVTLRFTRSVIAGLEAVECVVAGDQLILSAVRDRMPKIEYFRRTLSRREVSALRTAIEQSGLLQRLNTQVHAGPEFPRLEFTDGPVETYQFPALAKGDARAHTVTYHGVSDEGARRILREINLLLPEKLRIEPLQAR